MSAKVNIPPKEEIHKLYSREGTTISSLAKHYSTSNPTVRSWLIKYNIPRKTQKQASQEANNRHRIRVKPDKEELAKLYEKSSLVELMSYFSVSQQTIYEWFEDFDINIREHSVSCKIGKSKQFSHIQFTKDFLDAEYDRSQPIEALATKLGVSRSHIRQQLRINGIKIESLEPSWRSKAETDLYDYLVSEFPDDEWEHSCKSIIGPFELDIVNKTKRIAVEYCGLYWHSEGSNGKRQHYHREKYLKCKELGIRLYTIFESDNAEKVKSLLKKVLGKTKKIGARKTKVQQLHPNVAKKFHQEHHLHSAIGGSHHYGLFHEGNLLLAASFTKNRFGNNHVFECARITSHSDYTVVGGVSRVMKQFINTVKPESIVTFADLRFGEGDVYKHCGFERMQDTPPNYWYSYKYHPTLHSRISFQKHKLASKLETFDATKTEYENMLDNGWDRIWDCGNAKYSWHK